MRSWFRSKFWAVYLFLLRLYFPSSRNGIQPQWNTSSCKRDDNFMLEKSDLIEELDLSFHPLTQKLWRDFEMLFGRHGACGGCWCMYWKLRGKDFSENTGDVMRQKQKSVVDSKIVPGLLAYSEGYPVA